MGWYRGYRRPYGTLSRHEWLAALKKPKTKMALPWKRMDIPRHKVSIIRYERLVYDEHKAFGITAEVFRVRGTKRWKYRVGYRNHSYLDRDHGFCYSKENAFKKVDAFLRKHKIRPLDDKGLARIKLFT